MKRTCYYDGKHISQYLRSPIPFSEYLSVNMPSTLLNYHGIDEGNHLFLVVEIELRINGDAGELGNIVNIALGVILGGWCPRGNDSGESGTLVVFDIAAHQDKASTHAIIHADELFKVGVIGLSDFAQPYVSNAYVKGVVVADAARNIWFHVLLELFAEFIK